MAEEQAQAEAGAEATAFGTSEFADLLQKEFRPKSDQAKTAVENAVKTLAEQALANTNLISNDALRSIEKVASFTDIELAATAAGACAHLDPSDPLVSKWSDSAHPTSFNEGRAAGPRAVIDKIGRGTDTV